MDSPNRRRQRVALALLAVLLGALLTACGGGGDGDSDEAGSTPATEWAGSVCGRIGSWLEGIQSLGTDLASRVETVGADLQAARTQLTAFFGDVVQRTDQMIQEVDAAGIPDTEKGTQITNDLKAGLSEVKQAFQDGQARIQNLPTGDPAAFQEQADQAFKDLTAAGDQIGKKFEDLDTKYNVPALQEAFQQAPQCQQLNS